jgi:hypothetical protein
MIEGGKVYVGSQAQFLASLWEMSAYFSADQEPAATAALNKLIQTLQVFFAFNLPSIVFVKSKYFFWGDFLILFILYSTLLHLPPLRFHCVDGC